LKRRALKNDLSARYAQHPARSRTGDGRDIELPFSWEAYQQLAPQLSADSRERALKAYYQHKTHTAWRYLSKPNPWMAPNAQYVERDASGGYSTFEAYKPLIVLLWLAAKDEDIPPITEFTLEGQIAHFIDELALI